MTMKNIGMGTKVDYDRGDGLYTGIVIRKIGRVYIIKSETEGHVEVFAHQIKKVYTMSRTRIESGT